MGYVKGCDVTVLSKYMLKKFENGKIEIVDELKEMLSIEQLREMFETSSKNFIDHSGKEVKGQPSGYIYVIFKNINKQKYLLGLAKIKRIAGEPSGKTGLAKAFENSRDSYILDERIFAPGYEKEEEYFEESVISHLKDSVGMGQVNTAEYGNKIIERAEKKVIFGGLVVGRTIYFLAMWFLWGLIFHNWGLGLCFAFLFLSSFVMITSKTGTKENISNTDTPDNNAVKNSDN